MEKNRKIYILRFLLISFFLLLPFYGFLLPYYGYFFQKWMYEGEGGWLNFLINCFIFIYIVIVVIGIFIAKFISAFDRKNKLFVWCYELSLTFFLVSYVLYHLTGAKKWLKIGEDLFSDMIEATTLVCAFFILSLIVLVKNLVSTFNREKLPRHYINYKYFSLVIIQSLQFLGIYLLFIFANNNIN